MNAKPTAPRPSKGVMAIQTRRPAGSKNIFPPRRDFSSLSLKDLLDAREAYHVYLSQLDNVIATAIGRYCIHEDDWYAQNPPDRPRPSDVARITAPRTLANSVIRPWSWPAVLVFVRQWEQPHHLGSEMVPPNLYLPDGRVIPTCVIAAPPDETMPEPSNGPLPGEPFVGRRLRLSQGTSGRTGARNIRLPRAKGRFLFFAHEPSCCRRRWRGRKGLYSRHI